MSGRTAEEIYIILWQPFFVLAKMTPMKIEIWLYNFGAKCSCDMILSLQFIGWKERRTGTGIFFYPMGTKEVF
jgi:hypothetical protein